MRARRRCDPGAPPSFPSASIAAPRGQPRAEFCRRAEARSSTGFTDDGASTLHLQAGRRSLRGPASTGPWWSWWSWWSSPGWLGPRAAHRTCRTLQEVKGRQALPRAAPSPPRAAHPRLHLRHEAELGAGRVKRKTQNAKRRTRQRRPSRQLQSLPRFSRRCHSTPSRSRISRCYRHLHRHLHRHRHHHHRHRHNPSKMGIKSELRAPVS